jgi:DNA-binding response OmpR family regulator
MLNWRLLGRVALAESVRSSQLVRFGTFEVDLQAGELRKSGVKLKLTGQPFQVLTILLERPVSLRRFSLPTANGLRLKR